MTSFDPSEPIAIVGLGGVFPGSQNIPSFWRNVLGKVDAESGESRRNENVPFNLIDNNALKELNVRMGATATIVPELRVDRGYFGVEFAAGASCPPDPANHSGSRDPGLWWSLAVHILGTSETASITLFAFPEPP